MLLATVVAYLAGADLAWTAVAGFTALLMVHRADPAALLGAHRLVGHPVLRRPVRGGRGAGALGRRRLGAGSGSRSGPAPAALGDYLRTTALFLVGSNVVSNVPFILVIQPEMARLPDPTLGWELLAMASTFAGNLTLLGSVANIIVAERGRAVGGLPFFAYLRVGLPLALITTALGTLWLLLVHGVIGP